MPEHRTIIRPVSEASHFEEVELNIKDEDRITIEKLIYILKKWQDAGVDTVEIEVHEEFTMEDALVEMRNREGG